MRGPCTGLMPSPPRRLFQRVQYLLGALYPAHPFQDKVDARGVHLGCHRGHRILSEDLLIAIFIGEPGGAFHSIVRGDPDSTRVSIPLRLSCSSSSVP